MENNSKENIRFQNFLIKLTERLRIITEFNVAQKLDPCEVDIDLIGELYDLYDKTSLSWVRNDDTLSETAIQSSLFTDAQA